VKKFLGNDDMFSLQNPL